VGRHLWRVQCALQFQSKRLASNGGVSAEEAAKEWAANIVPGGGPSHSRQERGA